MAHTRLILGAPGCGKTTRLIELVAQELSRGVQPEKIAFVSFTRQAASVALTRARERFGLSEKRFGLFRTLHSLAFRGLHMRYNQMVQPKHYIELCAKLGIDYSAHVTLEEGLEREDIRMGNRLIFIDSLARNRCESLETVWRENDTHCELPHIIQFSEVFAAYKKENGLYDYTDILTHYVERGAPFVVDVAVVDEAQDLSRLQWRVVKTAFPNAERTYIAGDDDQAIYEWSGADVDTFLSVPTDEKEVLSVSHRLTYDVKALADTIIGKVSRRYNKIYQSRDTVPGGIEWRNSPEVELASYPGSWMLLARNTKHLREYINMCREQGLTYKMRGVWSVDQEHVTAIKQWQSLIKGETLGGEDARKLMGYVRHGAGRTARVANDASYTIADVVAMTGAKNTPWYDALEAIPVDTREYYLNILRSGGSLTREPTVSIGTIHSVKGEEADNVMVLTDVTNRIENRTTRAEDAEHRVFYVAVTRAKHKLFLVQPQTLSFYQM